MPDINLCGFHSCARAPDCTHVFVYCYCARLQINPGRHTRLPQGKISPRAAQKKRESGGGRSIRAAEQTRELNRNPECQLKQGM